MRCPRAQRRSPAVAACQHHRSQPPRLSLTRDTDEPARWTIDPVMTAPMDHRPVYHLVPNAAFGRYERLVLLKSMTLLTRHSSHSTPKARRQPPLPSQKAPASMTSLPQRRAPDDIVAATTPLVLSPLVSSAPFATPAFAAPRQTTDFRNRGADACTIRNTGSTDTAGSTASYRRQHRHHRQHRQLPPAAPILPAAPPATASTSS